MVDVTQLGNIVLEAKLCLYLLKVANVSLAHDGAHLLAKDGVDFFPRFDFLASIIDYGDGIAYLMGLGIFCDEFTTLSVLKIGELWMVFVNFFLDDHDCPD